MPRGDRSGPMGMGPMTGRGAGYCSGFAAPGYANPAGYGGGFGGGGLGRGRGFRRMFYATGVPGIGRFGYPGYAGAYQAGDEKTFLKSQAEILESELEQIKKQLDRLDEESD